MTEMQDRECEVDILEAKLNQMDVRLMMLMCWITYGQIMCLTNVCCGYAGSVLTLNQRGHQTGDQVTGWLMAGNLHNKDC